MSGKQPTSGGSGGGRGSSFGNLPAPRGQVKKQIIRELFSGGSSNSSSGK